VDICWEFHCDDSL